MRIHACVHYHDPRPRDTDGRGAVKPTEPTVLRKPRQTWMGAFGELMAAASIDLKHALHLFARCLQPSATCPYRLSVQNC